MRLHRNTSRSETHLIYKDQLPGLSSLNILEKFDFEIETRDSTCHFTLTESIELQEEQDVMHIG